uniref:Uncharacterized protein n=1 Tax=Hyaloperonospora arabidopsidis (strain Emoy2) TaxID=559515 RepID=M4C5Q5_HYAAE
MHPCKVQLYEDTIQRKISVHQAEETLPFTEIKEHMDDTAEKHDPSMEQSIPLAKIPDSRVSNPATSPCRESLLAMTHRAGTKMLEK